MGRSQELLSAAPGNITPTLTSTDRRGQPGHVLKTAAARRGLSLAFQRTMGSVLRFKVVPMATAEVVPGAAGEPVVASDAPVTRRGGRRKAAVASAG
jgi:hypothetical protein